MKHNFKKILCFLLIIITAAVLSGCQSDPTNSENAISADNSSGSALNESPYDNTPSSYETAISNTDSIIQSESATDTSSSDTVKKDPDIPNTETSADNSESSQTFINISVNGTDMDCILYDTELAREIVEKMPFTVSMEEYIGREYYGRLEFTPQTATNGQFSFETGDLVYCPSLNSLAIFYAHTDETDLTIEVIPIGKVTFDLSVFTGLEKRADFKFSITT